MNLALLSTTLLLLSANDGKSVLQSHGRSCAQLVNPPPLPSHFATRVVTKLPGSGQGAFTNATWALGAPIGGGLHFGGLDVYALGQGGLLTLGFDATLHDGPGADFTVFENAILSLDSELVFAEVAFVEVSTNGVDFARFPSRYTGPIAPGAFQSVPLVSHAGLAGALPVIENPVDPQDPVVSGGDTFDLADLAGDPKVLSGQVDLGKIRFVRLIDIASGTELDSGGTTIYDSGAPGSCDIDAIALIQTLENASPCGPTVDFFVDQAGFAHLVIFDPEGTADIDLSTLGVSVDLLPMSLLSMTNMFLPKFTPTALSWHWTSSVPVIGSGMNAVLAVSVRDQRGDFSADRLLWQN